MVIPLIASVESARGEITFAAAKEQAVRSFKGPGGRQYVDRLVPKIQTVAAKLMTYDSCFSLKKSSGCNVVLIISKAGRVEKVLAEPNNRVAACLAPLFKPYRFPPPPRAPWYQSVEFEREIRFSR
jgi:hypothetical protein